MLIITEAALIKMVAGAAAAVGKQALASFLKRQQEEGRAILLHKISRTGDPWRAHEDAMASMLMVYLRAVDEGVARDNLRLMAAALRNAGRSDEWAPDEFRRSARVLADLSREEILLIAGIIRIKRLPADDDERRGVFGQLRDEFCGAGGLLPDGNALSATLGALARTGLVAAVSGFGGLDYAPTYLLDRIQQLVDIEAELQDLEETSPSL